MKYRDENLILGSDPAVLSSPSYKCIRQQHSTRKSLEAGSLKMNTVLLLSTVQEWSRRGAVDVKRVLLTI
jgi:hypothetical protein